MRANAKSAGRWCAFVLACAPLGAASSVEVTTVAVVPQTPKPDARLDFAEFLAGLAKLRNGDESDLARLRVTADRCGKYHGRPDVRDVLEFYAGLPAADRVRGLTLEKRFDEIYARVKDAERKRSSIEEWREQRLGILEDLDVLLATARDQADFTPAARVLSLRALIQRQRVVEDAEFDAATKHTWIKNGMRDAEEAITLFTRAGMVKTRLEPTHALAWFDWADGDWAAAQQDFEEVLEIARRVGHREYEERALNGLVRLAHDAGDMPEIARLLDELARVQAPAITWGLAARHGAFLLALDEPERAAEFLARNKPTTERETREWNVLMRGALTRKGDIEGAAAHENVLAAAEEFDFVTRAALAEARLERDRADLALELLGDGPWPAEASSFLRATRERLLGRALAVLGRRTEAIAAFERAFAIGDSIESRMPAADAGLLSNSSVVGEVIGSDTVAALARAWIEEGHPLRASAVIEDRQSRTTRSALSAHDWSGGRSTDRRGDLAPIDTDAVRAWSASFEAGLITWAVGTDKSVVVHVSRSGTATGAVLDFGAKRIEDAVRRLREAAVADEPDTVRDFAAEIQTELLPVTLVTALSRDKGRILLCAHGALERLPFDLLPIFGGDLVPLVLPGLIEHSPGVGIADPRSIAWTLVGDPIGVEGAALLPGVRSELDAIARLHPGAILRSGATFDRAAMNDALASGRALHIATHLRARRGSARSIDTRAANAGFELSDNQRFSVEDIQRARPRLPMAVLSACDTGGGLFVDAQASVGMSKAFLEAGTRNLLVTLWPVEDQAARRYTTAFHQALARGELPSRAAASARDALRSAEDSIADWAAFRLLGRD